MNTLRKGLCDLIARAETPEHIDTLLEQGTYFEFASGATRRRWVRLAEHRRKQLDTLDRKIDEIIKRIYAPQSPT